MDDNQISFTTTESNAKSFNRFFHNYEIIGSYEDYLFFDEEMDPLFDVEIPYIPDLNTDKSLYILNFVFEQFENQKITINNEQVQSDALNLKIKFSRIESDSSNWFKIIGIRRDVEICKKVLEDKFNKFYQSRTKIQYSEDIDPEINVILFLKENQI